MPSDQSRIIEQAKFTYLALGKLKKKNNWWSRRKTNTKQSTIKDPFPGCQLNEEAKNEIERIKEQGKMVNKGDLILGTKMYIQFPSI